MRRRGSADGLGGHHVGGLGPWTWILAALVLGAWQPSPTPSAVMEGTHSSAIQVEVDGLRNSEGRVIALLFAGPRGFPSKRKHTRRIGRQPIRNRVARIRFENLPPGEYAISLFHDENSDDRLNTNWIGLPTEGIAVSNGQNVGRAFPRFHNARFTVGPGTTRMPIRCRYLPSAD